MKYQTADIKHNQDGEIQKAETERERDRQT